MTSLLEYNKEKTDRQNLLIKVRHLIIKMLAPCDWAEHDEYGKYVVEVHGRTEELECVVLKIQGYRPYFYVPVEMELSVFQKILQEADVKVTISSDEKYDVYEGFNFYKKTLVWKLEVDSLKDYRNLVKITKSSFKKVY